MLLTLSFRNRVTPGSKAAQGDLCPGDTILAINGDSTEHMTHMEAQNRIKTCTQHLTLSICEHEVDFYRGSGNRNYPCTELDKQRFKMQSLLIW
ncbi:PDZ and LIM domain protein 4 [Lates japonicus]|uniref:PDZ and LIM domain protein 4 n=1 Tax=Lates japonicus TaxID=270547 RepID=A0AAD3M3T6_LATJO|nr:PDZ and LIM domain protein 4 [Lates japonicus]